MQPLSDTLSSADLDLIRDCLRAMVEGPFVPEWEFETVTGVTREEMRVVLEAWPLQTLDDSTFDCAIVGAMNSLTGYPHRKEKALVHYVPAGYDAICWALDRLIAVLRPDRKPADPWVPLSQSLSAADIEIVREALRVAVEGPFFPGLAFEALFGMERAQVEHMRAHQPSQSLHETNFAYAACQSLTVLLDVAPDRDEALALWLPAGRAALRATLARVVAVVPGWREARELLVYGRPGIAAALLPADLDLIRDGLRAAIDGGLLPEKDFPVLIGVQRAEVLTMLDVWPKQTLDDVTFAYVACQVLRWLIDPSAEFAAALASRIAAGPDAIEATLERVLDVFVAMDEAGTLDR